MASTKMARNRKVRDKKFNELPWIEKERIKFQKRHREYVESIIELNKLMNNGQ